MRLFNWRKQVSPIPPELQQYYQLERPSQKLSKWLVVGLIVATVLVLSGAATAVYLITKNQQSNKLQTTSVKQTNQGNKAKPKSPVTSNQPASSAANGSNGKGGTSAASQAPKAASMPAVTQTNNQPANTSVTTKTSSGLPAVPPS